MADTITVNYGWVKPDPGGDANTWGITLNSTTDKIDAQVFTNAQAGVPIGAISMWATATPPTHWLICDGSSLATSGAYAALFAVLGTTYNQSGDAAGTFRLPRLVDAFPFGAGNTVALAAVGGETVHTLTNNEIASHAHSITDVAHNHGINQSAHNHGDPSHTHGASAGDSGAHIHGSSLMRFVGSGGSLGVGASPYNVNTGNTDAANAPGVNVSIAYAATGIQAANANISLNASGTGLSTTNADGGGAAHNNMPPYIGLNFIIKYA